MATMTLTKRQLDASPKAAVPIEALAGGMPTPTTILALDLGHATGWALAAPDGGITSGTEAFRHDRWQGAAGSSSSSSSAGSPS